MRNIVIRSALAAVVPAAILLGAAGAQAACGPSPRPLPTDWSVTLSPDGKTTFINTGSSQFPQGDSFGPNPTNLLPTEYTNLCDKDGQEIPNTLPSTPAQPYNLHPDPIVSPINKTSPTDDLDAVIRHLKEVIGTPIDDRIVQASTGHGNGHGNDNGHNNGHGNGHRKGHGNNHGNSHGNGNGTSLDMSKINFAIDVLEGNSVPRAYSGLPVLHYNGPLKTKVVQPVLDGNGAVVGGTVTINQAWYDTHIESDTSYIDPTVVMDVPWTIRYVVNVLNRGHEDFAPYAMWFNGNFGTPHVGMDQTFFPMEEGLQYVFEMKMPPAKYWNLTYNWGWRIHPPRVQVTENVLMQLGGRPRNAFETDAFGVNPRADEASKLAAIDMIGDLSPAKRMWKALRAIKAGVNGNRLKGLVTELEESFDDWQNRNRLPRGVKAGANADETLFYVNNTIYGHVKGMVLDNQMEMTKFKHRGDKINVKLLNGDYFVHSYVLVDFGGMRGWENTFHNTMPIGGAGALFTFGRNHWWVNTASGPVMIPPATRPASNPHGRRHTLDDVGRHESGEHDRGPKWNRVRRGNTASWVSAEGIGEHDVEITFNYEPSPRLRMYQFDAFHHDIAVWSVH